MQDTGISHLVYFAQSMNSAESARLNAKGKRILIVDDAKVFLDAAEKYLAPSGATLLKARSGLQALQMIHKECPDMVILDLIMPDMTGDKICAHIKQDPLSADIPVLIVTSRGRQEELELCRKAGCDDFLTKPVRQDQLLAKVCDLVRVSSRHAARFLVRMEKEIDGEKQVCFGTSTDLSKTGISVTSDKHLRSGDNLTLRFKLPVEKNDFLIDGQIVRVDQQNRRFRYGIQFANVTLAQRKELSRFLETLPKRNADVSPA